MEETTINEAKSIYATIEDYKQVFLLGREQKIPDASFKYYSRNASREIDKHTSNRLKNKENLKRFNEEVIRATCGIAEILWSEENETEVISQSHGGFSQTFGKEQLTQKQKINKILKRELGDTGLLFLGRD